MNIQKETKLKEFAPKSETPQPTPVTIQKEPLKVLYEWDAPIRPFKKRDKEVFTTAFSMIFLISVILLFIKEFLLIMVLISLGFLFYVFNTIKPHPIHHQITTKGIKTLNKFFDWNFLGRYWFDVKMSQQLLHIENFKGLPTRLIMIVDKSNKNKIDKILGNYLLKETPDKSQIEKAGEWLQKKVPLETNKSRTVNTKR